MSGMTGGDITTLTGNAGGLIPASGSGNFNIVGSGTIVVTGAPATHTLTISGGGVTGMTEHAMVVGNAAGGITSLAVATDGQLPIGSTGNNPVLATLTAGNNIGITNAAGSITIKVNGTTNHTLQVGNATGDLTSLAVGGTGVILQGNAGADPTWTTATYPSTVTKGDVLVASADNVVGSVAGATTAGHVLMANGAGSAPSFQALPASGIATVTGTANQVTATTVGSDVTLSTPSTFIAPGTIASTTTNTAGTDLISTAGNLLLPDSSSTIGQVKFNSIPYLHNYGTAGTTSNLFLGYNAGNFTLTPASSLRNVGIGTNALAALTTATDSVCIGYSAGGRNVTSGSKNVFIGSGAGNYDTCYAVQVLESVAIGYNAVGGGGPNGSSKYVAIGYNACKNAYGAPNVTAIGYNVLGGTYCGANDSTVIGEASCSGISSGAINQSTIIGKDTCLALGSSGGISNFALNDIYGYRALKSLNNHWNIVRYNCLFGSLSATNLVAPEFTYNSFFGYNTGGSLNNNQYYTDHNTFVGANSGATMTSGNGIRYNTFIGSGSGNSYPAGANTGSCICIGYNASGSSTETNILRIGNATGTSAGNLNASYICGIYGRTPVGTLNVALVDSNNQLGSIASLDVANGGTGAATLTDHGVLLGSGTGAITPTAVGATGEVLIGNTGADASWSASPTLTSVLATTFDTNVAAAAVTLAGTTLSADGTDADININITAKGTGTVIIDELTLTTQLAVAQGGTGATTLTDHGILLGSGTGAITPLGSATNGQLPIGSTGADPVLATITAGAGIAVTNGAGTISIATTGAFMAWSEITDATKTIVVQEAYVANRGTQITFTLPATAALGTEFKIQGKGAGLWKIEQNAGQQIYVGSSATAAGAGGYLEATDAHDAITLVCITADTTWAAEAVVGNITVA